MRRFWNTLTVAGVAALSVGLAQDVRAQDQSPQPAPTDARKRPARSSPLYTEMGFDVELLRSPMGRQIFAVLSEANLQELLSGADPADVITLTGRSLREELTPNALGGSTDELVFTPLNPCRAIDTRNAGGAFTAGEERHYNIIGPADYSSIGGNAAGCGIPGGFGGGFFSSNVVRALVVNVVAASASGLGNFQAWPTNQTPPTASIINFGTTQNIANGLDLKTCDALCIDIFPPFTCGDPCPGGDLSFRANNSSVHLVVDVLGYFTAASLGSTGANDIAAAFNLANNTCTNIGQVAITNSSNVTKTVICQAYVNIGIVHTNGAEDDFLITLATDATTCGSAFDAGTALLEIDTNVPTFVGDENETLSVSQTFSLPSTTTQTYFLNANAFVGGGDDDVFGGKMICFSQP